MVQRRVCVHASDDGAEVALTPRRTAKDVPFGKCADARAIAADAVRAEHAAADGRPHPRE